MSQEDLKLNTLDTIKHTLSTIGLSPDPGKVWSIFRAYFIENLHERDTVLFESWKEAQ